jgi:glutamate dehydrogenase
MTSESTRTGSSPVGSKLETFIADYYEHLADEDAQEYDLEVLRARAGTHWDIALTRQPKTANVQIRDESDCSVVYIVTDDMPFLVDSVNAELVRQHAAIHLVVHPLLVVARNKDTHELVSVARMPASVGVSSGDTAAMPNISHLLGTEDDVPHLESWIAIEIDRAGEEAHARLIEGLTRVLGDVRAAIEDWQPMRAKAVLISDALGKVVHAQEIQDLKQTQELLRWLDRDNFTFLGYREYDLKTVGGEDVLTIREGSGLGLLRSPDDRHEIQHLTEAGRKMARERRALVITKANSRSSVHRPAYFDYIGIKSFDADGNVNGEQRFIGLFAASAYTSSVRAIPILREKVDAVMAQIGFPTESHSGKDLMGILETYPRDELFQMDVSALVTTALAIQRLQERRRTRLFLRPDIYGRFMSARVYLPRDRYTTAVRLRIENELQGTFHSESLDFEARMTESALARLFYRIRLPKDAALDAVDAAALERRLAMAVRSWPEGVTEELREKHSPEDAEQLSILWADAFPASYRVDYEIEEALEDIGRFEAFAAAAAQAAASGAVPARPGLHVYHSIHAGDRPDEDARVKLYMMESQSLSQILPYFQNLGLEVLDEVPFEISTADGRDFFLYDLGLNYPAGVDPVATDRLLADSFGAAVTGAVESDGLDRLVLQEGMPWHRVVILRSYAKYLRQIGNTNSYEFVADTLLANPAVAGGLIALFEARFDPELAAGERTDREAQVRAELTVAMEQVATLDADRVLRTFIELIEASLRTNFFQQKPYLSIKLDPTLIESLPFPRPRYEIWVYSPRVEGVHLRFGKVARGGLRWSDRREDFRTEILGLV